MKTTVKFEGGRELERALGQLGTLYRRKKASRDALMEGAEIMHAAAQANAPVRSEEKTFGVGGQLVGGTGRRRRRVGGESRARRKGALRMHINIGTRLTRNQARQNRANKMPVEVYVGTRDRAGVLSEFGTRYSAALGWFRRAWMGNHSRALEVIKAALWKQISRQAALQARAIKRGRK